MILANQKFRYPSSSNPIIDEELIESLAKNARAALDFTLDYHSNEISTYDTYKQIHLFYILTFDSSIVD